MDAGLNLHRIREVAGPIEDCFDWTKIQHWIDSVDEDAVERLVMYINEAGFFWPLLEPYAKFLGPDASVLEIGSGVGVISLLLASNGARVISCEPETAGFGRMDELATVIKSSWLLPQNSVERIKDIFPSSQISVGQFDLVLAINVVEHVDKPELLILDATSVLKPHGKGFFVCPNYSFPYEPHFEIPTLFNKRLTEIFFKRRIKTSKIDDSERFWSELSWPKTSSLSRFLRKHGVVFELPRTVTDAYFARLYDDVFLDRKGRTFRLLVTTFRSLIKLLVRALPARFRPIIFLVTYGR